MQINLLQQQDLDSEQLAHLRELKKSFCAFVSEDYMMGKICLPGVNLHNPPRPTV